MSIPLTSLIGDRDLKSKAIARQNRDWSDRLNHYLFSNADNFITELMLDYFAVLAEYIFLLASRSSGAQENRNVSF